MNRFGQYSGRLARDTRGFTLIEIGIVVVIISIMATMMLPRMGNTGRAKLRVQASRLSKVFRLLRHEAILQGMTYQLNYDLAGESYWVTVAQDGAFGDGFDNTAMDLPQMLQPKQLDAPVQIADVVLPARGGKMVDGNATTFFYPDGTIDPLVVIHLTTEEDAYTLWLNPMRWRLEFGPGYEEIDYGQR